MTVRAGSVLSGRAASPPGEPDKTPADDAQGKELNLQGLINQSDSEGFNDATPHLILDLRHLIISSSESLCFQVFTGSSQLFILRPGGSLFIKQYTVMQK